MNRHIPTYFTALLTVLLSACQTDYFEPGSTSAVDPQGQPIVLKLTDAGLPTRSSVKSRAIYEEDVYTHFEDGDKVGFFAIGSNDNVIAKNIPYIYNENDGEWVYDEAEAGSDPEKHRVYYDAEMVTYIIYYPYTADVDDITCYNDLKSHDVFNCRLDQSDKEAFRFSDLMASVINLDEFDDFDESRHLVQASLSHVRNCLIFDIETRWNIGDISEVTYKTPLEALENFFFYSNSETEPIVDLDKYDPDYHYNFDSPWANDIVNGQIPIEYTCRFEDGCYRYILPDTIEGILRWNYTYHDRTYVDDWEVSAPGFDHETGYPTKSSECYYYMARHDMGSPFENQMHPGDLYCTLDSDGDGYEDFGFPLPWEAREFLDENYLRCIGMIVYVGRNPWDDTVYPSFGDDAEENKVNGYVISLTYAGKETAPWWNIDSSLFYKPTASKIAEINKYCPRFMDDPRKGYWNGYYYNQVVRENAVKYYEGSAFDVSENYGEMENNQAWDNHLAAPGNSTGWFLPSIGFLEDNNDFLQGIFRERIPILHDIITRWFEASNQNTGYEDNEMNVNLEYPYSDHIHTKCPDDYWCTCTEAYEEGDIYFSSNRYAFYYPFNIHNVDGNLHTKVVPKTIEANVRPVLVF